MAANFRPTEKGFAEAGTPTADGATADDIYAKALLKLVCARAAGKGVELSAGEARFVAEGLAAFVGKGLAPVPEVV